MEMGCKLFDKKLEILRITLFNYANRNPLLSSLSHNYLYLLSIANNHANRLNCGKKINQIDQTMFTLTNYIGYLNRTGSSKL